MLMHVMAVAANVTHIPVVVWKDWVTLSGIDRENCDCRVL